MDVLDYVHELNIGYLFTGCNGLITEMFPLTQEPNVSGSHFSRIKKNKMVHSQIT